MQIENNTKKNDINPSKRSRTTNQKLKFSIYNVYFLLKTITTRIQPKLKRHRRYRRSNKYPRYRQRIKRL